MTEHLISIIITSIAVGLQSSLGIYFILFNSEKKKNILVYFSLLTLGDFFSLIINTPFVMLPFFICLIIYIYFTHNKSLYPLISIPLTYMIAVFFNELYSGIFGFFFHINTETLINHYPLFFSYSILCILSIVTFILMGKKIVQHIIGQSIAEFTFQRYHFTSVYTHYNLRKYYPYNCTYKPGTYDFNNCSYHYVYNYCVFFPAYTICKLLYFKKIGKNNYFSGAVKAIRKPKRIHGKSGTIV